MKVSGSVNPLISEYNQSNPLVASTPTLADAADYYTNWLSKQRAQAIRDGLIDPQSGLPTSRALVQAARQYGVALALGAAAPGDSGEADILASRLKMSYKPPEASLRPFDADYPSGAPFDAAGNLAETVDGSPISAGTVVGRGAVSAPDVAFPVEGYDTLAKELLGATPTPVAARSIAGDAGRLSPAADPATGDPAFSLGYAKNLPSGVQNDVIAHEIAHGIDYLAGSIPQDGIKKELGFIYHTLNSPQPVSNGLSTPQNLYGYTDAQAPKELMAEAIRGYMQNPNWIKTVAPNTAARIRAYVNNHPMIKNVIQFNSAAGILGAANGAANQGPKEQ